MSNMSYCRFQNTAGDLEDCVDALKEIGELEELSDSERSYAERMKSICENYLEEYEYLEC
jgi:hypothetical protein